MSKYSVVPVYLESGEVMPMLEDSETGLGVFEPTAYALHLRSRNLAVNTISQALRSVQLLYQIADANKINLLSRIKENTLLTLGEIEALQEQCKLKKHDLDEIHFGPIDEKVSRIDIARLKKGRRATAKLENVDRNTAAIRMKYLVGYLKWLVEYAYLQNLSSDREKFLKVGESTVQALNARTPSTKKRSAAKRKRGWTKEDESKVLALMDPTSVRNPWSSDFLRNRNYLILGFLLATGVRKGELLGIKLDDLNFTDCTVFIARRADDVEDPRRRPPTQKTYDRVLALGADLVQLLKVYIKNRASITAARRHPFLFVTEAGAPMALNTVDFMFSKMRQHLPEIKQFSAHICRHTWNDRFSEIAEGRMNEAEEKKVRNFLMGWSHTSQSAENYTVRFVEMQAKKAIIELQNQIYKARK